MAGERAGGGVWVWFRRRLAPVSILLLTVPVLVVASLLEADASGVGTHESLGLPPCAMYRTAGVPCMTCGYTTAFTHAAHGRLVTAFMTQPAAAMLALVFAMLTIVAAWALIKGVSLAPLARRLLRPLTAWSAGAVFIVAWIYKVCVVQGFIQL